MDNNFKMPSTGKIVGITLLVIVGFFILAVIGSAMNLITIPWLKFNRQVQMNRDIVTKTYTADNAIYNYHWFKERAQSITALGQKITDADTTLISFQKDAGPRKDWTFEDKTEESRLRTISSGLKAQYHDIVAEYNARAGEVDRAIFKDGLPLFFNLNAY